MYAAHLRLVVDLNCFARCFRFVTMHVVQARTTDKTLLIQREIESLMGGFTITPSSHQVRSLGVFCCGLEFAARPYPCPVGQQSLKTYLFALYQTQCVMHTMTLKLSRQKAESRGKIPWSPENVRGLAEAGALTIDRFVLRRAIDAGWAEQNFRTQRGCMSHIPTWKFDYSLLSACQHGNKSSSKTAVGRSVLPYYNRYLFSLFSTLWILTFSFTMT